MEGGSDGEGQFCEQINKLALITFDEGGSFTVNERFAAWYESSRQESAWRKQVVERSMDVYSRTGNLFAEGVGKEMLEHHRSLPLIEQSLIPAPYETELQAKIATSGQDTRQTLKMEPMSLLYLLNKWAREREEHGLPSLDGSGSDSTESNIVASPLGGTQVESGPAPKVAPIAPQGEITTTGKATSDFYNVMLKIVFGVSDPKHEPAVSTKATLASNNRDLLTSADRKFLARTYEFATQTGSPLEEVDGLAFDLAHFRFLQATGNNIESKPGMMWNTDGSPRYYRMTEEDSLTATRILKSQAAASTDIDHGFIAFLTNPRGSGWTNESNRGHAVSFAFLEKLINADSAAPQGEVATESIEFNYKNSLSWIERQDEPDLPLEGWTAAHKEHSPAEKALANIGVLMPEQELITRTLEQLQARTLQPHQDHPNDFTGFLRPDQSGFSEQQSQRNLADKDPTL